MVVFKNNIMVWKRYLSLNTLGSGEFNYDIFISYELYYISLDNYWQTDMALIIMCI